MPLKFNVNLAPWNTFGVASRAWAMAEVEHWYQLDRIIDDPRLRERPLLVLGGGSNVLFRRDYPGLVLKVGNRGITVLEEDDEHVFVRVAAGETWHDIVIWSVLRGLWGLENLALIPGQTGAAPIQNIGAYGAELADCFVSLQAFDRLKRQWVTLDKSDCQLAYRSSLFKDAEPERYIISEVVLRLNQRPEIGHGPRLDYPGVKEEIDLLGGSIDPVTIAEAVTRIRQRKLPDPHHCGNAGSFFKNPLVDADKFAQLTGQFPDIRSFEQDDGRTKLSAAWLIDQCHYRGYSRGDAGVYHDHALVLVNLGAATGQQIWELALEVQQAVHDKFGIVLEPEPLIV